ncbi:CPBP family intramembrane glutamic endopeptidase [Salinibacter altiplanensis]|uniref:CPBP family intramembrane glutamic endopeptidase n=1 Tax=Salinibacter altiplanensis TaxID=1803181 RepID=UPI001F4604CE|nr:CPBP family intramembrane glutamic endopeptidase [Salinibacter altiplanensis]
MAASSSVPGSVLFDPWHRRGRLPLDGPLERASVGRPTLSFVTGLLGLGAAFLLFQFLLTPIALLTQIALAEGGLSMKVFQNPERLVASYTQELLISNSIGQVVGLAGPALLAARLHSSEWAAYLRLRGVDGRLLVLALVGIVGLQPVTQWLAELNRALPLPESLRVMEQSQLELIRSVLESDLGLLFNVTMLALVPGVCEELLFRGYAQRQFERAAGPVGGILLAGGLFGLYHLRPSQALPLTVLGLYMAYLVWRTGSLVPAVLVHIVHNGLAVAGARYVETHPDYTVRVLERTSMPWSLVGLGFVIVGGVLYVMHSLAPRIRDPERGTERSSP